MPSPWPAVSKPHRRGGGGRGCLRPAGPALHHGGDWFRGVGDPALELRRAAAQGPRAQWGSPAGSTELHEAVCPVSLLFVFPETEQNNFLYTYKAQKEKTTELSKRRGERPPLRAGQRGHPVDIELGSGRGLLVGSCKRTIPQEPPHPDRQLCGGGRGRRPGGEGRRTLSQASPATHRRAHGRGRCPERSCGGQGRSPPRGWFGGKRKILGENNEGRCRVLGPEGPGLCQARSALPHPGLSSHLTTGHP